MLKKGGVSELPLLSQVFRPMSFTPQKSTLTTRLGWAEGTTIAINCVERNKSPGSGNKAPRGGLMLYPRDRGTLLGAGP